MPAVCCGAHGAGQAKQDGKPVLAHRPQDRVELGSLEANMVTRPQGRGGPRRQEATVSAM